MRAPPENQTAPVAGRGGRMDMQGDPAGNQVERDHKRSHRSTQVRTAIASWADLERLTDDLSVLADWKEDLDSKIARARLRFELIGFDAEEQEQLEAEGQAFLHVCRCLAAATVGSPKRMAA